MQAANRAAACGAWAKNKDGSMSSNSKSCACPVGPRMTSTHATPGGEQSCRLGQRGGSCLAAVALRIARTGADRRLDHEFRAILARQKAL
jgi:hypothetical protein